MFPFIMESNFFHSKEYHLKMDFGDGQNPQVNEVDPNCPVFRGIVAKPLTPASIIPAGFQFTQATIGTPAKITDFTAKFNNGSTQTFKN